MRKRRIAGVGALIAFSLVAAACGGGSSDVATNLDANVKNEIANQLDNKSGATEKRPEPKTPAELKKVLEDERKAQVAKIKAGGWGYDKTAKKVTGPEGFVADISKCPSGWSDTEGITDTEIKIGASIAQSGPLADYGNILKMWQAYVDELNASGGITDSTGKTRKVKLVTKDDKYDPTVAVPLIDELLDSDKTFLVWNGSSPITMRTYDKLNQRCVPQPFVWTGHPAWGDPVNHPWTMGSILNYFTEAILWGSYIERTLPKGTKVGAVAVNNDFGAAYIAGFKAFLSTSSHGIQFEFEKFEPTAPTITNEMTTIASKKPDVFIVMSAGATCAQAITEAAANGLAQSAKQLWQPSVCKSLTYVGEKAVGQSSNGWRVIGGGIIDLNDPNFQSNAGVQWGLELLKKSNVDPKSSSNLNAGMYLGIPLVEMLKVAGDLPGGLTRTNYLLAMRTMDMTNPLLLPGLRMTTNGNKDAFVIEGSEFAKFDASKQAWVQEGETVDLSGKSKNCAWSVSTSTCN